MSSQQPYRRTGTSSMGYNNTMSAGGARRNRKPADRGIETDDGVGQPQRPNRKVTLGDIKPTVPKRHARPAIPQEFQKSVPTRKETMGVIRQPHEPARRAARPQTDIEFQPGKKKTTPTTVPFNDEIPTSRPKTDITYKPPVPLKKFSAVQENDIVFEPPKKAKKSKKKEGSSKKKKKPQRVPSSESQVDDLVFQRKDTLKTKNSFDKNEDIRFQPQEADIEFKPRKKESKKKSRDTADIEVARKSPSVDTSRRSSSHQEFVLQRSPRQQERKPSQQTQSGSLFLQADRHATESKRPSRLSSDRRRSSAPSISSSRSLPTEKKESSRSNVVVEPIPQPQFYFSEPLRDERVCAARFLVASNAAEQKLYSSMRKSRIESAESNSRRDRPVPAKGLSRRRSSKKEKSSRSIVSFDDEKAHSDEDESTRNNQKSAPPAFLAPTGTPLRRHHSDISLDPSAREEVERPRQPQRKQTLKEVGGLQSFRLPSSGESVVHPTRPRKRADEDDGALYAKYFKMLSVGIPLRAAKNNMALDYLDPSILDNYRYHRLKWQRSSEKSVVYSDILQTDHATYYKMLSAGVPLEAVQQRMEFEGLDPSTLDMELYQKTKSKLRAAEGDQYDEGDEDEQYAKYFNMLARNMVMKDVREEMAKDGLDPNILDNYQYKKVDENGRESMIETIQEDDEEEWDEEEEEATMGLGKYFMMLSIGVPMQAVKQSAYQDGFDPDDLHHYQYERLDWEVTEDDVDEDDECDRIWEGDFAKYYKMLSAGVPIEGVQQRMRIEGWDPDSLDVELYHKAKKKLRHQANVESLRSEEDTKYAKYFNMLGRGVIMADVRSAMEQDGLDPDVLDAYQYKPI